MKISKGDVLLRRGTELVTAVNDNFGKTYRGVRRDCQPGDVLTAKMTHQNPDKIIGDGDESAMNYKIIQSVHVNTVKALLRKLGMKYQTLYPGLRWYEVHGD